MQRFPIVLILLVVLCVGGAGYHFYSKHQARIESERVAREVAIKAAAAKEKKAADELRRLQEREKEQARRVADLEMQQRLPSAPGDNNAMVVGPLTPGVAPAAPPKVNVRPPALVGQGPMPGQPVPVIIPAAEKFIAEARLTSTSLDSAPYAVINRATYRVGNRIAIGPGTELTIISIDDGFVIFSGGAYKFKMRLAALAQ